MEHITDIPARELIPGFHGRFVHGTQSTLAFWEIKQGCIMPEHQHPHEQITHIITGEYKCAIEMRWEKIKLRVPIELSH